MNIINLSDGHSVINQYLAEIRDTEYQQNRQLFRNNIRRIGQMMAYEISKVLSYQPREVTTPLGTAHIDLPSDDILLATILRAGLPFHEGFLDVFDHAANAFVSAFRMYTNREHTEVGVHTEYMASPTIEGKTLIIATGKYYLPGQLVSRLVKSHFEQIAERYAEGGARIRPDYDIFTLRADNPDSRLTEEYSGAARSVRWQFSEPGLYYLTMSSSFGNICKTDHPEVQALTYAVAGPSRVRPGASVRYAAYDAGGSGRKLTLSLDGPDGITLAEDGRLTVSETVQEGTGFRITAVPSGGGEPAVLNGEVVEGIFMHAPWKQYPKPQGILCGTARANRSLDAQSSREASECQLRASDGETR